MNVAIEVGHVSRFLEVNEIVLRFVPPRDATGDFAVAPHELRVQGHITNKLRKRLNDLKYDVSYYSREGRFLGLDRSQLYEDDEIEPFDQLPVDMSIDIPDDTYRCVFNVRAKRPGWFGRLLWG